ncbi:MAG: hypothetical protein GF381_00605 [Candidatus Pacebacteria bacterium]|nr:hypothetical protein [Candidatus Paceibacterota bacterium]
MSLEQVFYIFGLFYLGFWTLIGVGLVIVAIITYRQYQQLKQKMKKKTSTLLGVTGLVQALPLRKVAPLISAVPLVIKLYQGLTGKDKS